VLLDRATQRPVDMHWLRACNKPADRLDVIANGDPARLRPQLAKPWCFVRSGTTRPESSRLMRTAAALRLKPAG
jgi:hypothetical protein